MTPLEEAGRVLIKEDKEHLRQIGLFLVVFDEQLQKDIGAAFRETKEYKALSVLQPFFQEKYLSALGLKGKMSRLEHEQ